MVIGSSMGGYGALKCALSKPEQYGACCAFSSACLFLKEGLDAQRENPEAVKAIYGDQLVNDFYAVFGDQLEWNPKDEILERAKALDGKAVKPKVYAACGTNDHFLAYNDRFAQEMKNLDFDFEYENWEGIHDWYFFDEAIKRALKKI